MPDMLMAEPIADLSSASRGRCLLQFSFDQGSADAFSPSADHWSDHAIGRSIRRFAPKPREISTGLGVPATRAATAEEFHRQFEAALAAKGPRLIECQVAIPKEMLALTEYIHKTRWAGERDSAP